MADYTIKGAPDGQIATQRTTDAYEVSNNGAGTYYETRSQQTSYNAAQLVAGLTPSNYTPAAATVAGNFMGIDNALGALGGSSVNFSVYLAAAQSIPSESVNVTGVLMRNVNFDNGGYYSPSPSYFNPKVPGVYITSFQGTWDAPLVNATVQFFIYKNASIVIAETAPIVILAGQTVNIPPLTTMVEMNGSTDLIQIYARQVQATGSAALNISDTTGILTYWVGALLDQEASAITPSTLLRSVYYSTTGSDIDGTGTIDFPFATVPVATTYALTLNPTLTAPVAVIGDPGEYTVTGLVLNPNINYDVTAPGVTWVGTGKINLSTTFTNAAASISIGAITVGGNNGTSTFGFDLDSSAMANFSCAINLNDGFVHRTKSPVFKAGAGHTYTLGINGAVVIDEFAGGTTFDGVTVNAAGPHAISATGFIVIATTSNDCVFNSTGNVGLGEISATTTTAGNTIAAAIFAGNQVTPGVLTDNFGNLITWQRDITTWLPGMSHEGAFNNTIIDEIVSGGFIESSPVPEFFTDEFLMAQTWYEFKGLANNATVVAQYDSTGTNYQTGTMSLSGTTLTGVGTAFTSAMIGQMVVFDDGNYGIIGSVTSGTIAHLISATTTSEPSQTTYITASPYVFLYNSATTTESGNFRFFLQNNILALFAANGGNANISTGLLASGGGGTYQLPDLSSTTQQFQMFGAQTLTDQATVTWNVSAGLIGNLTTAAARTISFPTNLQTGQVFTLNLTSAAFQPTFASGYNFPDGVPNVNSVAGAVDIFIFEATSSSTANLISYTSSLTNWNQFDGNRVINGQLLFPAAATTGGVTLTQIPGTNNVAVISCNGTSGITGQIITYDSTGRPIHNNFNTSTSISTTGIVAQQPQVAVATDGLHIVVSFMATVSSVLCQNLWSAPISSTSFGSATTVQVRATETVAGPGSVIAQDTTNFGLVFRTGASNILYAYPCTMVTGTITVGSSPLTIETGNTNTTDVRQAFNSSTTSTVIYQSTVTATAGFGYAAQITWNGVSSAPTIGTSFEVLANCIADLSKNMAISPLPANAGYFVTVFTVAGANTITVIKNISGTITAAGTGFNNQNNIGTGTSLFVPDANHAIISQTGSHGYDLAIGILNISSAYAVTSNYFWFLNTGDNGVNTPQSFAPINNGTMALLGYFDNGSTPQAKASLIRV